MNTRASTVFLRGTDVDPVLDALAQTGPVYIPVETEDFRGIRQFRYRLRKSGDHFTVPGYRPLEPLKQFCFTPRLKVAEYPESLPSSFEADGAQISVIGAAACDVASLKSLDAVFLQEEWTDIFYRNRRERLFLVSADCALPRKTCFCTRAGGAAHPAQGFDLNLSPSGEGYVVEAGSEKGSRFIEANRKLFGEVTPAMHKERERRRAETDRQVDSINAGYELSRNRAELLEIQRESSDWYEQVATCVDCGACLFACPTCHCFLLSDHAAGEGRFQRFKVWDACSYAGFSRMAGGGSPRLGLMERFRHRYLHKFEYYPKNFGFEACTGCGRCIEGCMGKIDMRNVFTALDRLAAGAGAL